MGDKTIREMLDIMKQPLSERVEIDTWRYEAAHGKKPRGDGSWYFKKDNTELDFGKDKEGVDYVAVMGTLRKAAEEAGKRLKSKRIWVQS